MSERADHLLRTLWLMQQNGRVATDELLKRAPSATEATVRALHRHGLVELRNGDIRLLEAGKARARTLIRRHLLAERLLADVLGVSQREMARSACAFEHILSPEVTESVCIFLGHPKTCPHGLEIPAGPCCSQSGGTRAEKIVSLTKLEIGESAQIAFVAPIRRETLEKLAIFGVMPGRRISLQQKNPACVVQVDRTLLALEPDIADGIYVRREST